MKSNENNGKRLINITKINYVIYHENILNAGRIYLRRLASRYVYLTGHTLLGFG